MASIYLQIGEFLGSSTTPDVFLEDDREYDLHVSIGAVPIPPAVWLFGTGLIGLVGVARKRKI